LTPNPDHNLLLVGKVLRPHGLDGQVKIHAYARSDATFLDAGSIFLREQTGKLTEFTMLSASPGKSGPVVELEGISSRTGAEAYRDAEVLIRKDAVPRKDADEYFWYELLGIDVFLESGEYLGPISDIIATGSNDIYVIKRGQKEVLIPGTHEIIRDIDLETRKMTIHPVEGLLDLHEI
jgi:16S rRNA processing protein RimM